MHEPGPPPAAAPPALTVAVALLVTAYALCGIFLPGRDTTVFSGDIGVKYMQVQALVAGSGAVDGLRDPLDTDGRYFPLRPPFGFASDGRVYTAYLNPLTGLASLGRRAAGIEGARALPLLGALACLAAVFALAGRLGLSGAARPAVVGATLLVTPLWFYGWVFWEHAPAAACALAATALLVGPDGARAGPRALAAGALLGLGAALRPEIAVFGAVLCGAVAVSFRRLAGPALAGGAGLLAFFLCLALLPDMPLAAFFERILEATTGRLPDADDPWASPEFRRNTFVFLYLGLIGTAAVFPPDGWLLAVGAAAAALLLLGFAPRRAALPVQLAACGAAVLASATALWAIRDPSMLLAGLLTGVPFVLATLPAVGRAATARPGEDAPAGDQTAAVARCLAWVALLFTAAVSVSAPSGGGNQWGQRFLLPVAPLLVLLLAWRLRVDGFAAPHRWLVLATAAALLAGAAVQAVGVRNHLATRRELAASLATLAALPARYVLATEWYVPQALTLLAERHGKRLLLATGEGDVARAADALARGGEESFVLIRGEAEPFAPRYGEYRPGRTLRLELVPAKLMAREYRRAP